jgi:exosortase
MTIARRHTLFALFCLALLLFALAPLRRLLSLSLDWGNDRLSYIPLIPLISAALIYWNRKKIFGNLRTSAVPAVAAAAIGGAIYYAARTYGSLLDENDYLALMTTAVLAFWLGGFLLFYGAAAFRAALFPLIFLGLMIPIPERILEGFVRLLQHGSSEAVSVLFTLTGTSAHRESDVIFALPKVTIKVAEACSGIRSTIMMLIITLLAAHLCLRSNWRKTALVIAVIPVSLFKNAVRIVTLTLLAIHYDMGFLSGRLHNDGGVLFMMAGLCLMYPVLGLLVRSEKNKRCGSA